MPADYLDRNEVALLSKRVVPSSVLFFCVRDSWVKQTTTAKFHIPGKLLFLKENAALQWTTAAVSGAITMKDYQHRPSAQAWGFAFLFFVVLFCCGFCFGFFAWFGLLLVCWLLFFPLCDAAVNHHKIKPRRDQSLWGWAASSVLLSLPHQAGD